MAYVTAAEVRIFTNLTTSEVSDTDLTTFIGYSTATFNRDTQKRVIREKVEAVDNTRENKVDGSNVIYYIQNWEGHYLADSNDDGSVTTTDVHVYQVASDSTETELTVSAVDGSLCKITLSAAPSSGVTLYITYNYCNIVSTHNLIKLAVAYLAGSYAQGKHDLGRPQSFSVGEIRMSFGTNLLSSSKSYVDAYTSIVSKINDGMVEMTEGEVPF